MKTSRITLAALVMIAAMAVTGVMGNISTAQGGVVDTPCKECIDSCPSGGLCWCAVDYCGDKCSKPPECEETLE